MAGAVPAPSHWQESCVHSECTLHQLSPYIGKTKSSIARDLILRYSSPGDLIVDPFCGSGTIALEAVLRGRRAFAADVSAYAAVLARAKLNPPRSLDEALQVAEGALHVASRLRPSRNGAPKWVKRFFHPKTLGEALRFAAVCETGEKDFLLACFLGILHHQRPGFLSYPCSHLVPYLLDTKYPRSENPGLYKYRPLAPRLIAKVGRALRRLPAGLDRRAGRFHRSHIADLVFPRRFDCLITSPPYMNALDYGRDNRLRLWFVEPGSAAELDDVAVDSVEDFVASLRLLAGACERRMRPGGHCILILGSKVHRSFEGHPSRVAFQAMSETAPSLRPVSAIIDHIPDVRRTRRRCRTTRMEHILVFRRDLA